MRFIETRLTRRHMCGLTMSIALLLFLVSACSMPMGGNNTGSSTQQCGGVHTFRSHVVSMDLSMARGAEDCFWQAFQQCQPATLTYTQSDSTASTVHTFSLQGQQGTCLITDSVQPATLHPSQPATSYTCASMQKQTDGLHVLSCGSMGNILIPAANPPK